MDIGAILQGAAEDAGYDDDEFDQEPPSPLHKKDTLSILRSSSEEVGRMDRSSSKDAFQKAEQQIKLDTSINTNDIEGSLARISETVNSNVEELARAGVQSRRGDETVSQQHRQNDDGDGNGAGSDDDDADGDDDDDDDDDDNNSDPTLERELFVATYRGNARKVDKLLSTGASYKAKDIHSWSALHWAVSEGHDDIVEILIDHAKRGSPAKLKKFINGKDSLSGWAPLHVAAIKGQKLCLKLLINAGAKANIKNHFGETPLQCINAETTDDKKTMITLLRKR